MKEIKTYADQYVKYYEVKDYNGLYKKFGNYEDAKNWYTYASKYYMSIILSKSPKKTRLLDSQKILDLISTL